MNALTRDCCTLPGTLVWRCELKEREQRGPFQFNKVISHPDSVDTSIYKTDSLSIGYRSQLIAFKMKSLQAEINAKRRIKAAWGWWNSQRTDTRITANSKDRKNCCNLTKLHKLDALHNDRITRCCCCSTGLLTEASGFLFAQISLEWFNEPISAEADTRRPVETQNRTHFIRNKTQFYHIHNWSPGIHISELSSMRKNPINIRIWCPIINVPPAATESLE